MKPVVWLSALVVCGCASTKTAVRPSPADTVIREEARDLNSGGAGKTIVYEFPGPPLGIEEEASVALKNCLYTSRVNLSNGQLGSDGTHDYATFFAGWEIQTGFEGVYYQYVVFVKEKAQKSWANSRVFIAPDKTRGPFSGPLHLLETSGEELRKKEPNKAPEPTTRPGAIRAEPRIAPGRVVAHL